jgi:hypothetical protein
MNLHRLDLCTLTVESAWAAFLRNRAESRIVAGMVLNKHYERIDERMAAKCSNAKSRPGDTFGRYPKREMLTINPLDHTAKGKPARGNSLTRGRK